MLHYRVFSPRSSRAGVTQCCLGISGIVAVLLSLAACTPDNGGRDIPVAYGGIFNPNDPEAAAAQSENAGTDEAAAGAAPASEPMGMTMAGSASVGTTPQGAGTMQTEPAATTPAGGEQDTLVFFELSDQMRNQVQAGDLCKRLATLQCAGQAHCCHNPQQDFAACQQQVRADCEAEGLIDQIAADPRSGFDASQAAQAFGELEALAMECDPAVSEWVVSPDGLMSMFRGSLSPDESCRPPVTSRERAAPYLASCESPERYACLPTSLLTWRCAPRGALGADCFTDLNCEDGLYCPQNDYLNPEIGRSTCTRRKGNGAGCRAANECASLVCYQGSCAEADADTAYCIQ